MKLLIVVVPDEKKEKELINFLDNQSMEYDELTPELMHEVATDSGYVKID